MKRGTILLGAVLVLSALQSFAIERLKTTRQAANVILSWPSSPSETYIVQYRPTLSPESPWQTLVPSLAAVVSTNLTTYVHTNGASGNNTGFYRVVCNDVHLFGITNGATIGGTVNVPIEYSVSSGDQVSGFSFSINSLPISGAIPQTNGVSNSLQWDTTAMRNGTYQLTPEIDFNTDDPVQGTPITLTVSNLVSYPNYFTSVFGQWMWIYAESAIYPANYQLDMYDSNTNNIGSFADYTPDGVISFIWDLTDGNGYTYPDDIFTGQFTITPTSPQIALPKSNPQTGPKPLAGGGDNSSSQEVGQGGFLVWTREFRRCVQCRGQQFD